MAENNNKKSFLDYFSPIAGFATDILGNILGSNAQDEANKLNLQIARESNEFNERMLEKQMAYNLDMWNKQNEYNDPAAQAQRLRDAGFSPLRMMSGMNTGSASSANGVSPHAATPARVEAKKFDLSAISNRFSQLQNEQHQRHMAEAQTNVLNQDALGKSIDNKYKARMHVAELAEIFARTKDTEIGILLKQAQKELYDLTKDDQVSLIKGQARKENLNADLLFIQKQIADLDLKYMEQEKIVALEQAMQNVQAKLIEMAQHYQRYIIEGEMHPLNKEKLQAEINKIKADARKSYSDAVGSENANKLFDSTFEYQVRNSYFDSIPDQNQLYNEGFYNKYNERKQSGSKKRYFNDAYLIAHSVADLFGKLGIKIK